ncbi:hypothetical protein P171DRAFT_481341 [Karstenula rhodostoma CBS 690.94]|uniref:Uncharacterized protein n=1 Tax=Karstenula rhodostoma CBS 690.94 TaxID=1392251 RepID=A0A9P4PSR0_9PLEO|nr:hypothetical protein P171DRAFT_481341 [Karstenula rhodostoma CBS 690.94]
MAQPQPESGSSRKNTLQSISLDNRQLISLVHEFLLARGGVASTDLILDNFRESFRAVPYFIDEFSTALNTIAIIQMDKANDTEEWKLKPEWSLPAPVLSPEDIPMIDRQTLFRILLPLDASRGNGSGSKHLKRKGVPPEISSSNPSAAKLHPRIRHSTLLEVTALLSRHSTNCQWYQDTKTLLADPRTSEAVDPAQVPRVDQSQILRVMEMVAQRSRLNAAVKFLPMPDELTNSIHPVLARPRWPDLNDQHWHILQPALRLASMFLTVPTCWEWFEHVSTGVVKQDHKGRRFIDPPSQPLTKEQRQEVVEGILSKIAKSTLFFCADTKKPNATAGTVRKGYASMDIDLYNPKATRIVISHDYILSQYGSSVSTRVPYLIKIFFMAKTLLHEIAHVFYNTSHRFVSRNGGEPSFARHGPLSRVREMGYSYEQDTFGHCLNGLWSPTGSPLGLFEQSLANLSDFYPGQVDVGSTEIDDLVQHLMPITWVQKWYLRSTWDKVAQEGLGFMRDEASSYAIRHKKNYPIPGWCITYNTSSHEEDVFAVAWPYASVYTQKGVLGIHINVAHSEMENEHGYTIQEKEFALAWETTYSRINVKALLTDRVVCSKHEKRKWEEDTAFPYNITGKKHKLKEPEDRFISNYALLENHTVGAFHKASVGAFGQLDAEVLAAEFADFCEEEARRNALLKVFDKLSVEQLIPDVATTMQSGDVHEHKPFSICDVMLDVDEKRLLKRGHLKGDINGLISPADEGYLIM